MIHNRFLELKSVEYLCSMRDDPFDEQWRSERWLDVKMSSLWPKLKLLAVYNADVGSDIFWQDVASLENMETLVLIMADAVSRVDVRDEWLRISGNENKKLTVWYVDVDGGSGIPEAVEETRKGDNVALRVA